MQSANSDIASPDTSLPDRSSSKSAVIPSRFPDRTFSEDEKFELLSAFLDDEVNEAERRLVEEWLVSDQRFKQHYKRQIKLREALRSLGVNAHRR